MKKDESRITLQATKNETENETKQGKKSVFSKQGQKWLSKNQSHIQIVVLKIENGQKKCSSKGRRSSTIEDVSSNEASGSPDQELLVLVAV